MQPQALTPAQEVQQQIAQLKEMLDAENPGFSMLLRTIHEKLKLDADVVTILSDEERGEILRGLKKQTGTTIVSSKVKSPRAAKTLNIGIDL